MKNLIVRFYTEVATISAIRETYPVATTTTADDTAIITDFIIIYSFNRERRLFSLSLQSCF